MALTKHIWADERPLSDGGLHREITVEDRDGVVPVGSSTLWYSIHSTGKIPAYTQMSAFVPALVFQAMEQGRALCVHGPVCRALLANIEEFQAAFSSWLPRRYRQVEIRADSEVVAEQAPGRPAALAFSGGLDSVFSYFRHRRSHATRYPQQIDAVMMVHGFDVRLAQENGFRQAQETTNAMLADDPVDRIFVKTNLREGGYLRHWPQNFGAGLASCFLQFEEHYSVGMIGSDEPYQHLVLPWGSNPITNPLLSSRAMKITCDSAGFTRTEKIAALAVWPQALEQLRVCYAKQHRRNCGACEKCIRTILNFRAAGLPQPACFPDQITDDQIRHMRFRNKLQREYARDILNNARKNDISDSWVQSLESALAHRLKNSGV